MSNDSSESSAGSSSTDHRQERSGRAADRPKKHSAASGSACTWCDDQQVPLKFIINQLGTPKSFCSENCVAEFRNAYRKGVCLACDNLIWDNAPHRDYCSTLCLNIGKMMNSGQSNGSGGKKAGESSSISTNGGSAGSSSGKTTNNNSSKVENLNDSGGGGGSKAPGKLSMGDDRLGAYGRIGSGGGSTIYQYEQLTVFDWEGYLKVRRLL